MTPSRAGTPGWRLTVVVAVLGACGFGKCGEDEALDPNLGALQITEVSRGGEDAITMAPRAWIELHNPTDEPISTQRLVVWMSWWDRDAQRRVRDPVLTYALLSNEAAPVVPAGGYLVTELGADDRFVNAGSDREEIEAQRETWRLWDEVDEALFYLTSQGVTLQTEIEPDVFRVSSLRCAFQSLAPTSTCHRCRPEPVVGTGSFYYASEQNPPTREAAPDCAETPEAPPVNRPPTVDLGPDQVASIGDRVTLFADAQDPDGDFVSLLYRWVLVERPEGSAAFIPPLFRIEDLFETDERKTIELDVPGRYVVQVFVTDGALTANDTVDIVVPEAGAAPLVINEVLPGSGPDAFVELLRVGPEPVDLSGWTLTVFGTTLDLSQARDGRGELVGTLDRFLLVGGAVAPGDLGPGNASLEIGDASLGSVVDIVLTNSDGEAVDQFDDGGMMLEPGLSFQRCETEPNSGAFQVGVGPEPTPAEDNACQAAIPPGGDAGYLKASNTGTSDMFGTSIDASVRTLVVGAPNEDGESDATPEAGAVYVFERTGEAWEQQAILRAPGSIRLGTSVAVEGDTVVAGAPGTAGGGRVYVFERTAGTWSRTAELSAWNAGSGDEFGFSVDLSGDRVAVGALKEDNSASGVDDRVTDDDAAFNSGAVYVYRREGSSWVDEAYIKASNAGRLDSFGSALALSGRTPVEDGDLLVVGAPREDSSATGVSAGASGVGADDNTESSGAAYVFRRTGTQWEQTAFLKASYAEPGIAFGRSVSVLGRTLAVGAPGDVRDAAGNPASLTDSGAVFMFDADGDVWSPLQRIKPDTVEAGDLFGRFVFTPGGSMLIGAPGDDSNGVERDGDPANNELEDSGALFLYRQSAQWTMRAFIKAPNPDRNDNLGIGVINGATHVLAAPGESSAATGVGGDAADNSAPQSGAVYLRSASP